MSKAILTKGLIASGKSTWAAQFIKEHQEYKRVNRDFMRHQLSAYTFDNENENLVQEIWEVTVEKLLNLDYNLIIDEQNLNPKVLNHNINFIKKIKPDIEIEIKEFPITLGEAVARDAARDFKIGEQVIKRTWRKYEIELKQMLERVRPKYEIKEGLPYAIICDIDGTLAKSTNRGIFDYKKCVNDEVINPVKDIIRRYSSTPSIKIILLSGRENICEKETKEWLSKESIPYHFLYMRKEGDHRADTIIKKELFYKHIADKYNILFAIDDRPVVLDLWVSMGLFTINVNQDPFGRNNF